MLILPNQAGVVLGLFAFAMASLVSIFSGVTLEVAILRGGVAFLVFLVFGWLMAYIIHDDGKSETEESESIEEEMEAPTVTATSATEQAAMPVAASVAAGEEGVAASEPDVNGLEAPDDSDF